MRKILIICLLLLSPNLIAGNETEVSNWFGLIPAFLAIGLSILTKQVIISLLAGLASGAFIHSLTTPNGSSFLGIDKVFDNYILNALADSGHASVILFSLLIAAGINLMTKMGAFNGLVFWLSKYAKSKRSALLISYFMGFFVFFDDYANTLVVGNTMQKITDKFKISREKLAFIVDATAAPIASIAVVSTWIGYEVQLISDGINHKAIPGAGNAYSIFLNAIPYSFYPIMILTFILVLILSGKDFGPMYKFEQSYKLTENKEEESSFIHSIWAVIPILVLLIITVGGIYQTGTNKESFILAIQTGNCYKGLIWGSSSFLMITFIISVFHRNKLEKNISWAFNGMKELLPALTVLILAWALNHVLTDLQLGDYLSGLITQFGISPGAVPLIVFVMAALIAFSTGSSFSTMGILVPIVISITGELLAGGSTELNILYASIAAVLSGAVLGDHCSPISDTTILSSMATGCNHINHVSSQLTYCLLIGSLSVVLILLNSLFHLNIVATYLIGVVVIYLIIKLLGK